MKTVRIELNLPNGSSQELEFPEGTMVTVKTKTLKKVIFEPKEELKIEEVIIPKTYSYEG